MKQTKWMGKAGTLLGLGLVLGSSAATQVAGVAAPQGTVLPPAEAPVLAAGESRIDVVFALDTTGSMSGLIDGAKQKIWSIVNAIALTEPRPRIRLGLVAYRDRGDEYVTRITPLTEDLDQVYADLMGLVAGGGGDGPESVNQALHEALTRMEWSAGESGLQIVYLVGDAEPHMDYADDVRYLESCALAATRGILVNAIQCGADTRTASVWREIANRAEGRYFAIDQTGGMNVVTTPFDDQLVVLGRELEGTLVHYGRPEAQLAAAGRKETADGLVAAAPEPALAERAVFNASASGTLNLLGYQELVDAVQSGRVDLDAVPVSELPAELQALDAGKRRAWVDEQAKKRADVQGQIRELAVKRDAYLAEERAKSGPEADSFDAKVLESLREQAAAKGLRTAPATGAER